MRLSPKFILALALLFFLNAFNDVFAAQVTAVKGKQILVSGDNLQKNGVYYTVQQGKKKGVIKVVSLKGNKGLAVLVKGNAAKGHSLVSRSSKTTTTARKTTPRKSKSSDKYIETSKPSFDNKTGYKPRTGKSISIGILVGYQQNTAAVDFSGSTESLSGSSVGFKLFGDYPLSDNFNLRAEFGSVPFLAEGGTCLSEICRMNISYLGGGIWGRFMLGKDSNKTRFWGGAGASLIFPTGTGDTNAVNVDEVGSTLIFNIGGGLDYNLNDKYFIPVSVEYTLFPPNDDVAASMILVKAGLGMRL